MQVYSGECTPPEEESIGSPLGVIGSPWGVKRSPSAYVQKIVGLVQQLCAALSRESCPIHDVATKKAVLAADPKKKAK